ncbi:MAG: ABC transporter ATP-binding protein [Clostridia bacterium]|nr:ABC transporter ATP-binding protein [Clostridia bacterium]
MDALKITGLKKSFGDKKVLCGLDLTVPKHSVFGFVGKNGAGKTTTMKAILGLLKVDDGEIFVEGEKVRYGQTPTNRFIGYLPDVPEFYGFLTAREYLRLCGESLGMDKKDVSKRSEELLALVGLSEENHRIKGYSRGMKQRLGIAQALLARPKLLICDEPTSALDPVGRKEILDILLAAKEQSTVLFSTHILSDVERICTDAAFLSEGKNALCGKIEALTSRKKEQFSIETTDELHAQKLIEAFDGASLSEKGAVVFSADGDLEFSVLGFIAENRIPVRKIERGGSSLESLFMEVINK